MKLILAIVNNDDSSLVSSALSSEGFLATKLATTGGFLLSGNTTFLIGVDDNQIDKVLAIIKSKSKKRDTMVPSASVINAGMEAPFPVNVKVGGATVFVLNVDRFEKM